MAESFLDAWRRAEKIEGWFLQEEAEALWNLCTGPWCEVGCWKGRSTTVLAETGHPGWAIDWFRGSPEHRNADTLDAFMENVGYRYPNVTTLAWRFEEVADSVPDGLSVVHLDADHSYEQTKLAFDLYSPKTDTVVFHDAKGNGWPGVERFTSEITWERLYAIELSVAFRRA